MMSKTRYGEKPGKNTRVAEGAPRTSGGKQTYGDTEHMERHQHGPDPVGAGKVIKTDD